MNNNSSENQAEPIYVRYARLKLKFRTEEEKVRKLKDLFSKQDNAITQERYDKILEEAEKIMAELNPEIETLKNEIYSELNSLNQLKTELKDKIGNIESRIAESKQLFSEEIIKEDAYIKELEQCENEVAPIHAELKKTEEKIHQIEKSLNIEVEPTDPKSNPDDRPISQYINSIRFSTNFVYRFLNTVLIIQGLCLLMFVLFRFLLLLDLYRAIPVAAIGFLLMGIFIVSFFLFFTVNPKPSVGIYFGLSITYFIISIFLFSKIGLFFSSFDGFYADSFTGIMAFWNLVYSILIFVVGCIRTFVLGVAYDYTKK